MFAITACRETVADVDGVTVIPPPPSSQRNNDLSAPIIIDVTHCTGCDVTPHQSPSISVSIQHRLCHCHFTPFLPQKMLISSFFFEFSFFEQGKLF